MAVASQEFYDIPAKTDGDGNVVLPAVRLGGAVERFGVTAQDAFNDPATPTLGELRHGFESVPGFRQAVRDQCGYGEWTRTAWEDGQYVHEGGRMVGDGSPEGTTIEDSSIIKVSMPSDGWVTEYHPVTGVPVETSSDKDDARAEFGDGASYFWGEDSGVRPVDRGFWDTQGGPFTVTAGWRPGGSYSYLGVRPSSRPEQNAERFATTPDAETLAELREYRGQIASALEGIDDLLSRYPQE